MRFLIDFAILWAAIMVVHSAYDWWWAIAAGFAVAAYGIFCFTDGLSRR